MNFWICVTTLKNWKVIKEKELWGVPSIKEKTICKVNPGDKLAFYIKGSMLIGGIFKAKSTAFEDEKEIFVPHQNEIFPWRINLKTILALDAPTDFRALVPKLEFIRKKRKWGSYLRGAMRTIPGEDFRLIEKEVKRSVK